MSMISVTRETFDREAKSNSWVIINNEVWDVTNFSENHPGEGINNQYIKDYAGKDASDMFEKFHYGDEPYEWMEEAKENPENGAYGIKYVGTLKN